jgi:hypothetical protein
MRCEARTVHVKGIEREIALHTLSTPDDPAGT